MTTNWLDLPAALRTILLTLTTTASVLGPSSDARALGPTEADTPSSNAEAPVHAELAAQAKLELERAIRILTEFEVDAASPEFQAYVEALGQTTARARKASLQRPETISTMLSSLLEARATLERDITRVGDWRRLALAVDPELEVIRIPRRFVRTSTRDPVLMEPWSPEERRVWMGEES